MEQYNLILILDKNITAVAATERNRSDIITICGEDSIPLRDESSIDEVVENIKDYYSILDFSLGAGAALGFGTKGYIGPIGAFAVNYTFAKNWVVFLRTNLGYVFGIYGGSSNEFYASGTAGFTYEFDV